MEIKYLIAGVVALGVALWLAKKGSYYDYGDVLVFFYSMASFFTFVASLFFLVAFVVSI